MAPGSLASSRAAISAVSVDGETGLAPLVDQEAAVGVAVEGQADVGALGDAPALEVDEVLRLDRVGLVVGEGAVELEVHRHQLDRSSPSRSNTAGAVWPAMPLPASTTTLSRRPGHRREGEQVGGVRLEHVVAASIVALARRRGGRGREPPRSRISASPVSMPIGLRAGAAHLDAVVLGGVVARGEHRAGLAEVAGGEVELVGGGQPDHHDVGAGLGGAVGEGAGQPGRARPHVVADDDACAAPATWTKRPAGRARQRLVDLVGHQAADVVGLEDGAEVRRVERVGHGREPTVLGARRLSRVVSTRRWPRRTVSRAGLLRAGGSARRRGAGRAASRTASASASRSSLGGPARRGSGASRSTSQPRGAESRSLWRVAEVVGVRLGVRRERAEHRRLVGVDVGERGDRGTAARGARTAADGTHARRRVPAVPRAPRLGSRRGRRAARRTDRPPRRRPRPARPRHARPRRAAPRRPGQPELRTAPRAVRRPRAGHRHRDRRALAGPARPGGVRRRGRAADPRRLGLRHGAAVVAGPRHAAATPTRLVLFRRPIEHRCETRADLEAMVLTVVVEQVAELLGIDAERGRPALRAAATRTEPLTGYGRARGARRAPAPLSSGSVERHHGGPGAADTHGADDASCRSGSDRDAASPAAGTVTTAPRPGPQSARVRASSSPGAERGHDGDRADSPGAGEHTCLAPGGTITARPAADGGPATACEGRRRRTCAAWR